MVGEKFGYIRKLINSDPIKMELPQPYIVRYTAYSPREAANLLHRINIEDTIVLPPVKPKAGDVFIYANKDAKGNKKNYYYLTSFFNFRYIICIIA